MENFNLLDLPLSTHIKVNTLLTHDPISGRDWYAENQAYYNEGVDDILTTLSRFCLTQARCSKSFIDFGHDIIDEEFESCIEDYDFVMDRVNTLVEKYYESAFVAGFKLAMKSQT